MERNIKLSDDQILKAVDWWTGAISNPKFDMGADTESAKLTEMLATMVSIENPVGSSNIEKFKTLLLEELMKENSELIKYGIRVDYRPCDILSNIMKQSGISSHRAPWKTDMIFREGKVLVAYGYAQEFVAI